MDRDRCTAAAPLEEGAGLLVGGVWQSQFVERLVEAKDALQQELLRCHEQLNLVFALTEQLSTMREPEAVERMLLHHYRIMLRAGVAFLDRGGCCTRLEPSVPAGAMSFGAEQVRGVLADYVEAVRSTRRSLVVECAPGLGNSRILLGAYWRVDAEVGVIVVMRGEDEQPFDASDVLASEAVLVYGAQILSNASMMRNLQHSALETVCALVNAIDAKDNYTSDHSERVGKLARLTGQALGLSKERLQALEWAGLLHDVGKIGIAEQILNKPGRLTRVELTQMREHPVIGYDMLRPVARFEPVLEAVLYHHENHDGTGYPEGRLAEEIPLEARIIHVVDIFDALTTNRPYRGRFEVGRAVELLREHAGGVTDPRVTRSFIDAFETYRREDPEGCGQMFGHLELPAGQG